ncbi:hypothetical protein HYFRA_00011259 [Hymenoscyphus fraxineus]|uniref:Uncharacterized protein n=1 Tax=Hymenoscyphus fraxineus TaxID=746836 RepID=A0A9N9L0C4_9HELO|nr:hypothetical protein HYFRA_00011259 [Hymenoscyphus fraxineus]
MSIPPECGDAANPKVPIPNINACVIYGMSAANTRVNQNHFADINFECCGGSELFKLNTLCYPGCSFNKTETAYHWTNCIANHFNESLKAPSGFKTKCSGPLMPDGGPTFIPNASITYDDPWPTRTPNKPSEAPSRGSLSVSVVLVVGLAFAGLMM